MSGQFIQPKTHALALSCLLALSACNGSTVKETLGLDRRAPDEFRVVSRPPLSVPPEFNLRPPAEGNEVIGTDVPASKQAESLVLGTDTNGLKPGSASTAVQSVNVQDASSPADAQFLSNAGATQADPSIRDKLKADTQSIAPEEKTLLDKLREPANKETTVNAKEEAERIKANKEEGKPITAGDTPVIKPKDTGLLGKIF